MSTPQDRVDELKKIVKDAFLELDLLSRFPNVENISFVSPDKHAFIRVFTQSEGEAWEKMFPDGHKAGRWVASECEMGFSGDY